MSPASTHLGTRVGTGMSSTASEFTSRTEGMTVYTIGHSTRSLEELLELLSVHGMRRLVDVRRWPGSRRHPHFAREALSDALGGAGIEYRHEPGLGGHRSARLDSLLGVVPIAQGLLTGSGSSSYD